MAYLLICMRDYRPPILPSPRIIVFGVTVQLDGFIFIPIKVINAVDPSRNELTKFVLYRYKYTLPFFRFVSFWVDS